MVAVVGVSNNWFLYCWLYAYRLKIMLKSESQQAWMSSNRWNTNTVSIFQEENNKVRIVSPLTVYHVLHYLLARDTHSHASVQVYRSTFTPTFSLNLALYLFAPIRIVAQYRLDFSRPPCIFARCEKHRIWAYVWWWWWWRYDTIG